MTHFEERGAAMMTPTVSVADARNNFSKIGAAVVESGVPVTVFRHSKPWLVISPAAQGDSAADDTRDASYERAIERVVERGEREYARGAYEDWETFLAHHPRR